MFKAIHVRHIFLCCQQVYYLCIISIFTFRFKSNLHTGAFPSQLNGDDFYSVAIKNIASLSGDGHVSKGSSPKAALTTVQFSSVTDLLRRIQNVNLALSITKWLAKQLQTGVILHSYL